ncbi:MAG: cytidine deaminase [Christensenellales bacterium]|jgi:cytidine deaminase
MPLLIDYLACFPLSKEDERLMMRAFDAALAAEGVSHVCYVSLTVCDDANIQAINKQTRHIDQPTDVLSFPTISYPDKQTAKDVPRFLQSAFNPDEKAVDLGEIFISKEHASKQAQTYGHSLQRELCYLLVHGVLHLLGHDHITSKEKATMRTKEEQAMKKMGLPEPDKNGMLKLAIEAMENSYSPYSHFPVGACLLTQDGSLYTGCNIENASYGLSNCAERTACFKAVSEGHRRFQAIAIAAKNTAPWPCGACRQVLSEFAPASMPIYVTWDGNTLESTLGQLLPHAFSPEYGIDAFLGKEK